MSLIADSINTMGDPNAAKSPNQAKSIAVWGSVKDWWNTPKAVRQPTNIGINSQAYLRARQRNLNAECLLFREILSGDIEIIPPCGLKTSGFGSSSLPSPIVATFKDTDLPSCENCFIHEFEITNRSQPELEQKHVVLVHGYMAASGYFAKNIEQLAKSYGNIVVHVIDLPGFGNSARPKFPTELITLPSGATKVDEINQILGVEDWFIDKLEEWRIQKGLTRFDLLAHSMGAYLCSCYLMKYNLCRETGEQIVTKFALISPVGTESSEISLIKHNGLTFNHAEIASNPLKEIFASQREISGTEKDEENLTLWEKLGKPKFPRSALLRYLWNNSISPFQVLQCFGPFYSKILSLWSFQRFLNLQKNDPSEDVSSDLSLILKLHDYSYSVFNQYQGSGELAITKIINHEILPRLPLCDRGFVEFLHESNVKTVWVYGEKDWMNPMGGQYCVEKLQSLGHRDAEFLVVQEAGHHIYLDNPSSFNEVMIKFFEY